MHSPGVSPKVSVHVHNPAVSPRVSNRTRAVTHSLPRNSSLKDQPDKPTTTKSRQDSNDGYESKLVEMINTAIVDRSPSVKWEDIGRV